MARVVRFTAPRSVDVTDVLVAELRPGQVRVRTLASGISAGTELTAYRGTNPYLTSRWDPDLRLFLRADQQTATVYPLVGWGYSEVGEVMEIAAESGGEPASSGLPGVGDVVWGVWGHASEAVLPIERLRGHCLPGRPRSRGRLLRPRRRNRPERRLGGGRRSRRNPGGLRSGRDRAACDVFRESDRGPDHRGGRHRGAPQAGPRARGVMRPSRPGPEAALAIRELTGGRGADVAIDLSGAYPALHESIRMVGPDGRVVAAGLLSGRRHRCSGSVRSSTTTGSRSSPPRSVRYRRPSGPAGTCRGCRHTVVDLIAPGGRTSRRLVSHLFLVEHAAKAYELLDTEPAGVLQVVFEFGSGDPT